MNPATLAMIVLAGLMVGGGLLLRRQVRQAPLVPTHPARKPALGRAPRRTSCRRLPQSHSRLPRTLSNRQCRLLLNREERRQRPGEGRN